MSQLQQLLTDHIDIWTAAEAEKKSGRGRASANAGNVYGIKKLRELILELAVRGKLVLQDASDEPASELLKRVQAEKAKLITEGKIKKSKPLAAITEEEKLFELPNGWEWTKLGIVAKKLTDGSHNPPKDAGTGLPMLSSQNINFGKITFDAPSRYVTSEDFELENSRTKIETNDVLLTIVGSLGRSAVVPCAAPKFVLQRSVAVIQTNLFSDFLCLQFGSPLCANYFEIHGKGTAQKGIYLGQLSEMPIAVPSIAEQHRIVAKVDELMALCDQLEAQHSNAADAHEQLVSHLLGTLTQSQDAADFNTNWQRIATHFDTLFTTESSIDALKQTLLQLAVMGKLVPQDPNDEPASELLKRIQIEKALLIAQGKIKKDKLLSAITDDEKRFELPEGWEWVALESVATVGTGTTPSRDNSAYFLPAEIPWVTSGETGLPFIAKTEQFVSKLALKETSLTVYPVGTLIVAMYGQGKTRGQISELCLPAATNQACAAIVLPISDLCLRKYVKIYFEKIYDEIRLEAAGGAQPNLNVGKVKATLISLPPLAEQDRIVAKVYELMALCDQVTLCIKEKSQLQQKLADVLVDHALN